MKASFGSDLRLKSSRKGSNIMPSSAARRAAVGQMTRFYSKTDFLMPVLRPGARQAVI